MKKTMLILLFGLLTVVGLPMVTEAVEPVNATDTTIFGAQAMVPNSTEDQTDKLQTLLSQTAKEGRHYFTTGKLCSVKRYCDFFKLSINWRYNRSHYFT